MASPSSWEFYKEEQTKILWVHICTQELTDVAISINKWWKTRYPDYKMRIVSKKEFEHIKMQEQQQQQKNYYLENFDAEYFICTANLISVH